MKKKFDTKILGIDHWIFWSILTAMILTHIVIFVFYSRENTKAELKVNHDIVTQQTMHVIETILKSPPRTQEEVVNAIEIPGIDVTLSKKPEWRPRMKATSLWAILVALRTQQQHLEISLKLESGQWLNVYASILPTSWTLQSVLLILETIVVTVVLFFIWSINRFSTPLKEFKHAAHRLGIDLESTPIDIRGPKIVRDTAKAMNQMQHRIHELVRERTQMLAAMSHDLRTPITRLKLRLQLLEDAVTSKKMFQDLDEMEEMINETLSFAREDSRQEAKTKLDLKSLLESLCLDYADLGKHIQFIADEHRLLVFGRTLALKRAFSNLIDNALKYATEATVSLKQTKNTILTVIEDNGPGVSEDELDKILQPFYRGEKSRSRDTGGTGLGLAVTKDIILAHQGSIHLSLCEEGGLRVTVTLPRIV